MPVAIRCSTRRPPPPRSSPACWRRTLSDNQKVLQELASIDRVRRMDPGSATDALDQFSRAHPNLYGLFLLDPQGNLVASTGLDPTQFQLHSAFIDAVDRSLKLGEPGVSNALTAPDARVIALTMPVRAKDQAEGEPIGVIGSLLSVERLGAAVTALRPRRHPDRGGRGWAGRRRAGRRSGRRRAGLDDRAAAVDERPGNSRPTWTRTARSGSRSTRRCRDRPGACW